MIKHKHPHTNLKILNYYLPNYFGTYRSMRDTIFIQEVQDRELKYTKERIHRRLSKLYRHNTNFNGRTIFRKNI